MNRICGHCKTLLPLDSFYADKRTKDGLRSWCKTCCSTSSREYNKDLRDVRLPKKKKYKERFYADPVNWEKKLEQGRQKYAGDPEFRARVKKNRAAWYETNRRHVRDIRLRESYGIGIDDYEKMLEQQSGMCAICSRPPGKKGLVVDHDHVTGRVRKLLCGLCNTALGLLRDDPALLETAAAYIRHYSSPPAPEDLPPAACSLPRSSARLIRPGS